MNKHPRDFVTAVLAVALLLPAIAPAAAPTAGEDGIVFSLLAPDAQAVFLAGDFNGWNATALPLTKDADGRWALTVKLDPGAYEYKFVVDGDWVEDPDNPEKKSDPFGGSNSLLTVRADGSVAALTAAPAAARPAAPASADDITVGAPRAVDGGVLFTFAGDGNTVNLAGSFNGWSATDTPLAGDGQGQWMVVMPLPAGEHQYKFVVDGNWLGDPENPQTQDDGYGGTNSLVVVGEDGQLVAAAAGAASGGAAGGATRSDLNARLTLNGRYLTRFELAKNIDSDPRWRLQRPSQSVDLNFDTEVSDIVDSYVRLRLDSEQNLIQNNIAGFLDEAHIYLHPGNFTLSAYWNEEIYSSEDVMRLAGNIDLPGTIGHDHLDYGKGTAGALIEADPWGLKFRGYFANIHNQDYYNDPELFDNTGGDAVGLRLSKQFGKFETGLPVWLRRDLVRLDFSDRVSLPSTGIPALDDHLLETGDPSNFYDLDSHSYKVGLDARYRFTERWRLSGQGIYIDDTQRFVVGDQSGQNRVTSPIDVPFLERDSYAVRVQVDYTPENLDVFLQHTRSTMDGAAADQRHIEFSYQPQSTANKQIYYEIQPAPAQTDEAFTEMEGEWKRGNSRLKLWAWHRTQDRDYGVAGSVVPGDSTRTDNSPYTWYLSGLAGSGDPATGLGYAELEFGLRLEDYDVKSAKMNSTELIARYDRSLTRNMAVVADIRYIRYHLEEEDADGALLEDDNDYFNPFVGLRYRPITSFELVGGYGVDPVDFSIAYSGRQLGRWWHRQNYLFDNPDASLQDAENNLAKARVFTLRAQFLF